MQRGWRKARVHRSKLVNYTRIDIAHKVRKNFFYVAVIYTITKGKDQIRASVSRYDQSV